MNKKLFVSDLDGTLLGSNEKLSDFTIKIINGLKGDNITFSYATARSFVSASEVTRGLSIPMPVIVYNGAFIIDSMTGRKLSSNYFTLDEVNYLKNKLIGMKTTPIVYSMIDNNERFSFIIESNNVGKSAFLDSRRDSRRREVFDKEFLYQGNIFYFSYIATEDLLFRFNEELKCDERFNCFFYKDIYTGAYFFEIVPKRVSKANAIKSLKEMFDIDEIISFGDGVNDISMFEISNECYAVSNACNELKVKATAVIGSNDCDGVARWIEGYLKKLK